jgi:uncharacterized protein (TIGR02118 family)
MTKVIALYKKPADPAAFDFHYWSTHMPLAKTMPGLRTYEVSTGPIGTPAGEASLHMLGILTFDSMEAVQAALSSPQGVATAGDLQNFAQAGVELLIFDTKEV